MKKDDIITTARERFQLATEAESENRELMVDDLNFKIGGARQWPENVRRDRDADDRPMITINRMGQFIKQVMGDIRQNSPSIKVRGVDDKADPETAEVLMGIIRHIEQNSSADVAYHTAAESAVSCGYGAFKITTEYDDFDGFEQDIKIKRIKNPFSVYFDPNANELSREDARWCFVATRISKEEFKKKYPDKSVSDFENHRTGERYDDWFGDDSVRIAEYWVKEPVTKEIALLRDGRTVELNQPIPPEMILRTRKVETHKVVQYIISGTDVLEGPNEWAGRYIPVVPVYGEEQNIEGKSIYKGVIRDAKDPQRLYNYWRTTAAEVLALQPKVPWVVTPDQIKGYERYWKVANKANLPYLLANPDPIAGMPKREMPPNPPAAMWQEAQIASDDMKAATGIYDAALGQKSNETSGKAILARQREADTSTFIYIDNLSVAIEYAGKVLVDLIPKIFDTQRAVRLLGEDGSDKLEVINQVLPTGETLYDLSAGKYDVTVSVGPSYSTKRVEAADSMMQFVQAVPQAGQIAADLIAKNMDWPGADEIAKRLQKMLPPGMQEMEEGSEEAQQMQAMAQQQAQQQAMQEQLQQRMIELEMRSKEAEIEKKEAAAVKDLAIAQEKNGDMEGLIRAAVGAAIQDLLGPPQNAPPPNLPPEQPALDQPPPGGFFMPE